jgi:phenylacetate-CoA ligase
MGSSMRRPHEAVDYAAIERMFPPPPEYFESAFFDDEETVARRQLVRLKDRAWQAYQVSFFRRRWDEAGFHPNDIRSLDDLWKAPFYTVDDLRRSIEAHPPYGDYQGVTPETIRREPIRVHMSGGTTGKSRPTFYTAWDRAVQGVANARMLYRQGVRPGDVVLNSWAYGPHNGAFCFDEAAYWWLNCLVIPTSTGNVTSTDRQVEMAIQYGASAILTTGDYLLRIADAAEELGYDLRKDMNLQALSNIGDNETLTARFGLECYNGYGFHELGTIAVECPAHDGLHIFEDMVIVQVVDIETGEPMPDGQLGSLCVTELCKTGSPQFRYNIMDLSYLYPPGRCVCGSTMRRIGPFSGRGDNMVKLRGINVWPEGVGEIAISVDGTTPDYFVRAVRSGNRDELLLSVVSDRDASTFDSIGEEVERRLQARLGVKIRTEVVTPGALDALTELHTSPKPKRFRDERGIYPPR